jgi:hypothetical protein
MEVGVPHGLFKCCGSGIPYLFLDPDTSILPSRIPGSRRRFPFKWRYEYRMVCSSAVDPGYLSWILIFPSRIPGSRRRSPFKCRYHIVNFSVFRIRNVYLAMLRIRIYKIRMFWGLLDPDPDPVVRGTDSDPDPVVRGTDSDPDPYIPN